MKRLRFKVLKENIKGQETVVEDQDEIRHIRKVLRLRTGDAVVLFNGEGKEYAAAISDISPGKISFKLLSESPTNTTEPPLQIILGMGLLKSAKFDWLVQKTTELGVSEIVPFFSEHAVPQWEGEKASSRKSRWEKIVAEAAKQCGRLRVPRIHSPCSFAEALHKKFEGAVRIFLWEKEKNGTLRDALRDPSSSIYALVGPEGGFAEREALKAQQAGFRPIRLGPRVLRAETAGVAIVSLLQFIWGDLN